MFYHVTLQELSDTLAQDIAQASLFASPRWLSIWSAIEATPLIFQTSSADQQNKDTLFGAVRLGSSPVSRLQAHIDGLPGMVISSSGTVVDSAPPPVSDDIRDSVLQALCDSSGMYAHWVDYFGQFSPNNLPNGWALHQLETIRLQVSNGSMAFADSVNRHIKSGKKSGATVRRARSKEDALATYELASSAHARHNRNRTYPPELYIELVKVAQCDDRVIWFICEKDGATIGAHIALRERDTVISWAPYINREARAFKPAYVLMDAVVETSQESGVSYVDLGVTPSGSSGVKEFKSRFGGSAYKYNVFVYRSLLAKAIGKGGL